jgi:hypothetical protein
MIVCGERKARERRLQAGFDKEWLGESLEPNDQFVFVLAETLGDHGAIQKRVKLLTKGDEKVIIVVQLVRIK